MYSNIQWHHLPHKHTKLNIKRNTSTMKREESGTQLYPQCLLTHNTIKMVGAVLPKPPLTRTLFPSCCHTAFLPTATDCRRFHPDVWSNQTLTVTVGSRESRGATCGSLLTVLRSFFAPRLRLSVPKAMRVQLSRTGWRGPRWDSLPRPAFRQSQVCTPASPCR